MTHPITHADGSTDTRYSVTAEFCGCSKPRWVLRFCGDWIDCFSSYSAAVLRGAGHKAALLGAPIIEEKREN